MPHTRHIMLVCDAKKGLFIRDTASQGKPVLHIEREFHHDLASRAQQLGTSPPGRTSNKNGPTSAMEPHDYHEEDKMRFMTALAHDFIAYARDFQAARIMIVAPPKALSRLREVTREALNGRNMTEINKDMTKHPMSEIETFLLDIIQMKSDIS